MGGILAYGGLYLVLRTLNCIVLKFSEGLSFVQNTEFEANFDTLRLKLENLEQ
jgi:hypothetical protein